jgi:hypothetical protein
MRLKYLSHAQHALKIIKSTRLNTLNAWQLPSMRFIRFSPKILKRERQRLQNEFLSTRQALKLETKILMLGAPLISVVHSDLVGLARSDPE